MKVLLTTLSAAVIVAALCPWGSAAEPADGLQQPEVSTAAFNCCEPSCGCEPNCAAEPNCCCVPSCGCEAGSCCGKDCCGFCRDCCVATVEKEKVEKHCWCTETKKICVPKVVCPWSKGGSGLTLFSFLKKRGGCCGDACCGDACCSDACGGCGNNGCCGNGCGCMKPRCGKVICVCDLKKKTYECEKCVCKWEIRRLPACCGQGCCGRGCGGDCGCSDCCGCGDAYEGIDSTPAASPQEAPAPVPAAAPEGSATLSPIGGLHFFNGRQW